MRGSEWLAGLLAGGQVDVEGISKSLREGVGGGCVCVEGISESLIEGLGGGHVSA